MAERLDAIIGARDAIRGQITPELGGDITPPENIIKTIQAAKAVYYKYRSEHVKRIQLYSQIEGLISGNPPYNIADLQKHGLLHIANFNTLDGRALYERGALAYWNLLNQAETLVKFDVRIDDPNRVEWADIMARNWDFVIRKWESFNTLMNTLSAQLVKFGISPIIWPDERSWKWRVIELPKFFVQDQAQSDVAQLTAVCVESLFTVQYLFEVYEQFKNTQSLDPATAVNWDYDKSPWNCAELSAMLLHFANTFMKTSYEFIDFMDLQRRLQNGDIGYDALFSDSVRIVHLLYKEYDGKITHYMFHRTFDQGNFLFKADRQYTSFQEALVIFTASPGEFTIHSNRGLGHKIFALSQAMMQLDCSIVDMARWSSTPLIRGLSTGSKDFEQIRFYPGVPTNIGTAEFVQNNLGSNINQLIGASQYLLQKLQFNTANSGDDPSQPDLDKGSISPTQARMQTYKEFSVLKNNIMHFYSLFDVVIKNMVVKMLHSKKGYPDYETAKEWKELCIDEGVPEELFKVPADKPTELPKHLRVRATRVAGDGSTLARIMGLQELMAVAGDFGPKEAREYKREWIMATMGPEYISAFMPTAEESDEYAGGASLAGVENAIMKTSGESALFSRDNEHQSHFATHMALATNIIQTIQQQQMDPVSADKIFSVLIPHLAEHYNAVAQSPLAQGFVAKVKKAFEQVTEYARLNRKNAGAMIQAQIRKQQEAEAAQQQVLSEQELKNVQAQNEEKRKDLKVMSQVQRAKEASDTRAEIMREKVRKDSQNQKLKIQLDHQNKMIENEGGVETNTLQENRELLSDINGETPAPYDMEI